MQSRPKPKGGLNSEAAVIEEQARNVKPLKEKNSLLEPPTASPTPAQIPVTVQKYEAQLNIFSDP